MAQSQELLVLLGPHARLLRQLQRLRARVLARPHRVAVAQRKRHLEGARVEEGGGRHVREGAGPGAAAGRRVASSGTRMLMRTRVLRAPPHLHAGHAHWHKAHGLLAAARQRRRLVRVRGPAAIAAAAAILRRRRPRRRPRQRDRQPRRRRARPRAGRLLRHLLHRGERGGDRRGRGVGRRARERALRRERRGGGAGAAVLVQQDFKVVLVMSRVMCHGWLLCMGGYWKVMGGDGWNDL